MRTSWLRIFAFALVCVAACQPSQASQSSPPSAIVSNVQRYCVDTRGGLAIEPPELLAAGWHDVGSSLSSVLPDAVFSRRFVLANRSPAAGPGLQFIASGVRTEPFMEEAQAMDIRMCIAGGDEVFGSLKLALEDWLGPVTTGSPTWIYLPKDAVSFRSARVVSQPEAERLGSFRDGATVLSITLLQNNVAGIMTTTITPRD